MKLYDISKPFFKTPVYPGDPIPGHERVLRMELGDLCNLTAYTAGAHTATHMDAPRHFIDDGKTIDQLPLTLFYGPCTVVTVEGIITGEDIDNIIAFCAPRILFKGNGKAFLSQSAAFALADAGVLLVGTDAQSIGPPDDEAAPHRELLCRDIPLLEGLELSSAPDGNYTLMAFPILMDSLEAAPVRAVLLSE